jgi:flagellin
LKFYLSCGTYSAMGISVYTNVPGDRVVLNVNRVASDLARVTERLSSGLRLRTEAPAAFLLSDRFDATIRGLQGADANIQQALAALDVSDAALATINDELLPELIDLATQASSGLLTDAQRAPLDAEFQAIVQSIDDLIDETRLGGQSLLDGSFGSVTVQVGAQAGSVATVDLSQDFRTTNVGGPLGGIDGLTIDTQANATAAVDALSGAAPSVDLDFTAARVMLSAPHSALEGLATYNSAIRFEYSAAQNRIVGADVAAETSRLVRDQLLLDAGASALQAASFSASTIVDVLASVVGRHK